MSETVTVEWDSACDGGFATDITAYVLDIKTSRGRRTDLGRMPPGTATLILNNHDGRFSADKADGAYHPNIEMYRRVRIKGAVDGDGTYGLFYGYVLDMNNKPKMNQQTVTWTLGDRFALWQQTMLNLPLLRKLPVKTALDMAVNRAIGDNACSNPSVEADLTGYTALAGVTATRDSAMKIEGDFTIRCDCPGNVSQQEGWAYEATSQTTPERSFLGRVWARASETVSLRFLAYDGPPPRIVDSVIVSVGPTPTLLSLANADGFAAASTYRRFWLVTNTATEVMFWSDGLFFQTPVNVQGIVTRDLDDGTAEIELAASYRQPALEVLQAIAESEPRSFFFMYCGNTGYDERLRFWDKAHRAVGPSATFSDDGADVPYQDLIYAEHALDRISECELTSQGDFEDENEESTIWELSPAGQVIPATETLVFHALYPQPSRDCTLSVNPSGTSTSYPIAAGGNDGRLWRYEDGGHPPDADDDVNTDGFLIIGQYKTGTWFYTFRTYLRFDTSGIGAGATVTYAKLKLKLKHNFSDTDFTIQVRTKAWGAVLAVGDWDGMGAIRGTYATSGLPPAGEWIEIDIAAAGIEKEAWTEFEIMSDNEAVEPDGYEHLNVDSFDTSYPPELHVVPLGQAPDSEVFENYGVGGKLTIGAGADDDLVIDEMSITGYPLQGSQEESKVVDASASPPAIERTLKAALPLQGTRTSSMETEADRLADFYDGRVWRCSMVLRPSSDTVLTQMLAREIGDKIHVENVANEFSTDIDGDMWIEGIEHHIKPGEFGEFHETIFHLEQA